MGEIVGQFMAVAPRPRNWDEKGVRDAEPEFGVAFWCRFANFSQ